MPLVAMRDIAACSRCAQPIMKGVKIEQVGMDDGRPRYAHVGCVAAFDEETNYDSVKLGGEPEAPTSLNLTGDRTPSDNDRRAKGDNADRPQGNQQGEAKKPEPKKPDVKPLTPDLNQLVERASQRTMEKIGPELQRLLAKAAQAAIPRVRQEAMDEAKKAVGDTAKEYMEELKDGANELLTDLSKKFAESIDAKIKKAEGLLKKEIMIVKLPDGGVNELDDEPRHEAFEEALELVGAGFNVFLPGPTGSGKTYMGKQIAKALGLDFAVLSGSSGATEAQVLGRSIPNITTGENVYQTTPFVRVYENGGLFLLDEADAMDPNLLLLLNSALANGYCNIPNREANPIAQRHPNFRCIWAANTFGHGATRMYCGRNKLDEATLDRFRSGTVPMDYDPALERRLCPDEKLYDTLAGWRDKVRQNRLQRVVSTRFVSEAYKMIHGLGKSLDYVAAKLAGGWPERDQTAVFGKVVAEVKF